MPEVFERLHEVRLLVVEHLEPVGQSHRCPGRWCAGDVVEDPPRRLGEPTDGQIGADPSDHGPVGVTAPVADWLACESDRVGCAYGHDLTVRPQVHLKSSALAALETSARTISPAYREPDTCWQHRLALTGGMPYRESARLSDRWGRRSTARPGLAS